MVPRIICSICTRNARVCNDFCEIDCGHAFHYYCLMDREESNICPTCNQPFQSTLPLHFTFTPTLQEIPMDVDGYQAAFTYSMELLCSLRDEIALVNHKTTMAKNLLETLKEEYGHIDKN